MKVLIVKTSSMGDVVHCLPAVTDLLAQVPNVQIDWVVEEGFVDIPRLHRGIHEVLPVAIRRWRKALWKSRKEIGDFKKRLRSTDYDLVIDAQGLFKSAIIAKLASGPVLGFDRDSAREPGAAYFYQHRQKVSKELHAVDRIRQLFSAHFGYQYPPTYHSGLESNRDHGANVVCLFHGTTWSSKHWPDEYWLELAKLLDKKGYEVVLPYFGPDEENRARHIEQQVPSAKVLPPGSLTDLAGVLSRAAGAVSVDTGLGHLAVAYDVPLVGLYGPTKPGLTGFKGGRQVSIADSSLPCAPCLKSQCQFKPGEHSSRLYPPCFESLAPRRVYDTLLEQIAVKTN